MSHLTPRGDIATNVTMKTILAILIVLSACADDIAYSPDAAPPAADAALSPDAAPVKRDCMGNLPAARTIAIAPGDPIPAALLNELQDMHSGDRRKSFQRQFFPTCWSGGAATLVNNPVSSPIQVWSIAASTAITRVPFESGDIIESLAIEVYGDGAVDWVGNLNWRVDLSGAGGGAIASNGGGVTNQASGWQLYSAFSVVPTTMPSSGGLLSLSLVVSGGTLIVGDVFLGIRR